MRNIDLPTWTGVIIRTEEGDVTVGEERTHAQCELCMRRNGDDNLDTEIQVHVTTIEDDRTEFLQCNECLHDSMDAAHDGLTVDVFLIPATTVRALINQ